MDNHVSKVPLTCGTPVSHRTQRVNTDLNNINPDDTNYDEDDSDTIIFIRFLDCTSNLKTGKHLKKNYVKN